jgi:hypothetical protein
VGARDRTVWRNCFEKGCGPVVRQTKKWWYNNVKIYELILVFTCVTERV